MSGVLSPSELNTHFRLVAVILLNLELKGHDSKRTGITPIVYFYLPSFKRHR